MKNGMYKPASEYGDDGIPCLRMYNIEAGAIAWRDIKRMRVTDVERVDYGLLPGDLLVNRVNSRELVGKAAVVPFGMEASVFESKNIRVRLKVDKARAKFINYQQKWLRLFEQLSPIFKWAAGRLQTVQSCPRRRSALATNRPTRWATRGAPQTSSYAASPIFGRLAK
jgi:hypothetical protein